MSENVYSVQVLSSVHKAVRMHAIVANVVKAPADSANTCIAQIKSMHIILDKTQ